MPAYAARMAEYLSDAWIADLDEVLRACGDLTSLAPLVIEQVVHDVPGRGTVRYRCEIGTGGARVVTDGDGRPDLRLTTDYATAVAIARGRENAQSVLAAGRLRLGGDVEALARHAAALGALADATAKLRDTTTYASP